MPMCDAYIPAGALAPDVERQLMAQVSELLVEHEIRRVVDLMDDPDAADTIRKRALAIAWSFVHRTDTYVACRPIEAPVYKFVCSVPEGQIDDRFAPAVNRDILQAVIDAEAQEWPHPERRVWVFIHEIPDGTWGAHGMALHIKEIIDFVSPGMGEAAAERLAEVHRVEARDIVERAGAAPARS